MGAGQEGYYGNSDKLVNVQEYCPHINILINTAMITNETTNFYVDLEKQEMEIKVSLKCFTKKLNCFDDALIDKIFILLKENEQIKFFNKNEDFFINVRDEALGLKNNREAKLQYNFFEVISENKIKNVKCTTFNISVEFVASWFTCLTYQKYGVFNPIYQSFHQTIYKDRKLDLIDIYKLRTFLIKTMNDDPTFKTLDKENFKLFE